MIEVANLLEKFDVHWSLIKSTGFFIMDIKWILGKN